MFSAWAIIGLIFGTVILAGMVWFVLLIFGKAVFEDMIGGIVNKMRKRREKKDRYIY